MHNKPTHAGNNFLHCFLFQQVKLNPSEVIQAEDPINRFVDYLDQFLVPQSIQQILPPSDVVGNIRFSHPTLYVFPGGEFEMENLLMMVYRHDIDFCLQARETLPCSGSTGSTFWLTVGSAVERAFGTLAATWTGRTQQDDYFYNDYISA